MGADLNRVNLKGAHGAFERSKKAIEAGYFRDAYNNGSILYQYNLLWWNDIGPLQNDDGVIVLEKVQEVRNLLEKKKYNFERHLSFMTKANQKYFQEGSNLLIQYLDSCIEAGDSIEASL